MIGVDDELKSVVVVFRGTSNVQNWLTDVGIFSEAYSEDPKCKNCRVHPGFYNSYVKLVKKGLLEAIQEASNANPEYGIIFTGHSLGGAVANVAAVSYRRQFPKATVSLYTYGQPRVGNSHYADYLDQQLPANFRVVHQKDIVPHKPTYFIGYRHSGTEIWYKDGMAGDYSVCKGESNFGSNSLGSFLHNYSVKDHFSDNYLQLFNKIHPSVARITTQSGPLDQQLIDAEKTATFDSEVI
jgi:hypothetical protein